MEIFTVINGYIMVGSAVFLLVTKLIDSILIFRYISSVGISG